MNNQLKTTMDNAHKSAASWTARDLRINSVPELELLNKVGGVITRLPLDGIRYRISAGEGGFIVVDQNPGDDTEMMHHCYLLDLAGQDQRNPVGRPRPSKDNNRFNFWYEPAAASADGQTAGTLIGIGAVDILDISILDRILPSERRLRPSGRIPGGRINSQSAEWPDGFPECSSPRVTLLYNYQLGIPAGSSSASSHAFILGASVSTMTNGSKRAHLVISCEPEGLQLDSYLET